LHSLVTLLQYLQLKISLYNECNYFPLWTRCNYIGLFINPSQLYIFRAMFSSIIRITWLYLQLLVIFTQVAAGWCLGWIGSKFQLIHDINCVSTHPWHQLAATWVNITRSCKYSQVSLRMGENLARNMYSWLGIIN